MNYYNKYLKYKSKYLLLQKAGYVDMEKGKGKEKDCKFTIKDLIEFENKNDIKCLDLSVKNITGQIPSDVINLFINLEKLNLSNNKIEDSIPELRLNKIIYLNLSYNNLIGDLTNISSLTNLKYLNLSNNYIGGNFENLSNLINLEYLNISNNNFTSGISNNFSLEKLINLEYLDISLNKITGIFPEYFTNFSKLEYLNIMDTEINGIIPNSIYNLSKLTEFYFSIENFDYKFKLDCTYSIRNYVGSCWNLALIMIFFIGDKTNKTVIEFFENKKNYDQYKKHIKELNNKFDIKKTFTKFYEDTTKQLKLDEKLSIEDIKEMKELEEMKRTKKIDESEYEKIIKERQRQKQKQKKNSINIFKFNYNIELIVEFVKQLSNRLKILNIEIPIGKENMLEENSMYIDDQTQHLYHTLFPIINREEVGGASINEKINFALLLAILIFKKKVKFMVYMDINLLIKDKISVFKRELSFYNAAPIEQKYIDNCIGINISIIDHAMAFYKCSGKQLFSNCYYDNKIIEFRYEDMFKNFKLLIQKQIKFKIKCSPGNYEYPFIIEILEKDRPKYLKADNIMNLNNIDNISDLTLSALFDYKEIVNFTFIMLEDLTV
jgi:hypothetical protein